MKSLLLICSMIAFSGCAPTKEISPHVRNLSPRQIIDAVNSRSRAIATFHATGSISVESPSFLNSGSFELSMKKPDSVRVDIEGPFGIRVASALFAHGHYTFYNSFRNEVMEGAVDEKNTPSFMNIRINPDDILDMFSGTRGFLPEEILPDSFALGDDSYLLQFQHGAGRTRYYVDDRIVYVVSIEHIDSAGAVWSEEHFDFDRRDDGTIVPQSIRLIHDKLESSVSLVYETVHINTPINGMTLTIPPDARRVSKE
jgi:outer membrane lipoprotein-sorting protein